MSTTTTERLTLKSLKAQTDVRLDRIESGIAQLIAANVDGKAPARTRKAATPKAAVATKAKGKGSGKATPKAPKVLTRGRAKALRTRYPAKYAGLTRAQMLEAGLRNYVLPTGELRASLSQG